MERLEPGDRVSVTVNEGDRFLFPLTRNFAVTKRDQPNFPVEQIASWKGRAAMLAEPITMWLMSHPQVASDDVYDSITRLASSSDPRIMGLPFQFLARKGFIKKVGTRRSTRKEQHFASISVWELVKKPWVHNEYKEDKD